MYCRERESLKISYPENSSSELRADIDGIVSQIVHLPSVETGCFVVYSWFRDRGIDVVLGLQMGELVS